MRAPAAARVPVDDVGVFGRRPVRREGVHRPDAPGHAALRRRVHPGVRGPRGNRHLVAGPARSQRERHLDRGRVDRGGDGRLHRRIGSLEPQAALSVHARAPCRSPTLPAGGVGGSRDGDRIRLRVDPLHRPDPRGDPHGGGDRGDGLSGDVPAVRLLDGAGSALRARRPGHQPGIWGIRLVQAAFHADHRRLRSAGWFQRVLPGWLWNV
jgi:hypothetical protein